MRKLIVKMSISLDGYATRTDGTHEWQFPSSTKDSDDWEIDCLEQTAVHLMGTTTYRIMARAWPKSKDRYAPYMNDLPKVVFSRSLKQASWAETRIFAGDLADDIRTLKAEDGPEGFLVAHGGPTFARSLVATGLVDEYRLLVHPVVISEGRSIFPIETHLEVVNAQPFSGGTVGYTLRPAASPTN